ncbi:MAG: PspC domain-containing protein [Acidimicrobiia bacterium]|nr:PspC domain-containing protein [Acidimicrobiia bacterium]
MTDTRQTQHAPPDRQLRRSDGDKILAGVAGGLGEHFGVNAWWFRIAFLVLALLGGLGLLVYLLAWGLVPTAGEDHSHVARWFDEVDLGDTGTLFGVILIGAAGIVVAAQVFDISGWLIVATILFAVGIILYRGDHQRQPGSDSTDASPTEPAPPDPPDTDGSPSIGDRPHDEDVSEGAAAAAPFVASNPAGPEELGPDDKVTRRTRRAKPSKPPKPPKPPREPSVVGRITLAVALIVLSGMALLESSGIEVFGRDAGDLFDPIHYAATGLAILGIGLVVASFVGRARFLIVIGILVMPLVFLAAVWPRTFPWTADDWFVQPSTAAAVQDTYALGAGNLTLDLTDLEPADIATIDSPVRVTLGAGEVEIRVPADVGVTLVGEVGMGQIEVQHQRWSTEEYVTTDEFGNPRTDQSVFWVTDTVVTRSGVSVAMNQDFGSETPHLILDVEVGAGRILLGLQEGSHP